MTEMSASALAFLQTAASAGLVVCLVMAGAFATLGFAASGEQSRRQTAAETERLARIGELLRENEYARAALKTPQPRDEEPSADRPADTGDAGIEVEPTPTLQSQPSSETQLAAAADGPPADRTNAPNEPEPSVRTVETADSLQAGAPSASVPDLSPDEDVVVASIDRPLPGELTGDTLPDPADEASALWAVPARKLAADEATAIADALSGDSGTFTVEIVTAPEAEARLYAIQLAGALRGAGIDAQGPVAVLTTQQTAGVVVSAETDADGPGALLLGALQSAGLDALPTSPGTPLHEVLVPDNTDVRLYVGGLKTPALPARQDETPARARVLEPA